MVVRFQLGLMVKSIYLRITLNYITLSFFLFSFLHCFTQGIIQSLLYTADDTWGSLTSHVVSRAAVNPTVFLQNTGRHGSYSLELCNQVPIEDSCTPFFTAGQPGPITIPHRYLPLSAQASDQDATFSRNASGQSNVTSSTWLLNYRTIHIDTQTRSDGLSDVIVTSGDGKMTLTLDPACTYTLLYSAARLSQSRREESSLIGTQFWFFGLAVFALIFESVPHILALIIARLLATGWSTYAVWRTVDIGDRMQHLIQNQDTPCHIDLYEPYITKRLSLQIADLVLHWDALLISLILSWRLYKVYRKHTFRRAGPSKDILQMYAYVLAVLVSIQLSVFILVNAMALWVDQLLHGIIKRLSLHTDVYDGTFLTTTLLLVPWLVLGWYSVRKECRKLTWAFLAIAMFFLFAWSMMFYSQVYRFAFVDWPFLGAMTITSFLTLISSTVFAFICVRNYGKGLREWLSLEQSLFSAGFEPDVFSTEDIEKEWKPDADRASISKIVLPELLRDGMQTGVIV